MRPHDIQRDVVLKSADGGNRPIPRIWRNDRQRRKTGVSDSAGADRREFVVNQLLPLNDMRLVAGADFDDFVPHVILEPEADAGPVRYRPADRRVMQAPRNVTLGRDAFARSRTKLLEIAARNIAAESRSYFRSPALAISCSARFRSARCIFIGVTLETDGLPRLGIKQRSCDNRPARPCLPRSNFLSW